MVQREKKRERLTLKYMTKRSSLKQALKTASTYQDKVNIYKKMEQLPPNSAPSRRRNRCWVTGRRPAHTPAAVLKGGHTSLATQSRQYTHG